MFFEDFSNPKFISDRYKDTWVFPFTDNFYLNNSDLFYESRLIRLDNPISVINMPNLLVVVPSTSIELKSFNIVPDITIWLYDDAEMQHFSSYSSFTKLSFNKGQFDYYMLMPRSGTTPYSYTQYTVQIKSRVFKENPMLNSIKIYGL